MHFLNNILIKLFDALLLFSARQFVKSIGIYKLSLLVCYFGS